MRPLAPLDSLWARFASLGTLGAGRVLHALFGETIFGGTGELFNASLHVACRLRVRPAPFHETGQRCSCELLVAGLSFAGFIRHGPREGQPGEQ